MPKKSYRHDGKNKNYKTITLTLSKNILDFLEEKTNETVEKNMSIFIENLGLSFNTRIKARREYGQKPVRKAFTLSEDFRKKLNATGNMSMAVELAIMKKYGLKF